MLGFSLFLILVSLSAFSQNGSINGSVTYKNSFNTPMNDSTVVYLIQNNIIKYTVATDSVGMFHFTGVKQGNYILKASSFEPVGGITIMDYVIILVNFINMNSFLIGLNAVAADVNGSGGAPNALDALAIKYYVNGAIQSFAPASPYVSTTHNVSIVNGLPSTQNIKVLCRGDVNGSYIPN